MWSKHSIESDLKLIAVVGGILFATLLAALFVVQLSLGSSQTKLAETVVPLQEQLARVSSAEGTMFLRQCEIIAANELSLQSLADREHHEDKIRLGAMMFRTLAHSTGLISEKDFPRFEADLLDEEIEVFLGADDDLYDSAFRYQKLAGEFSASVESIEKDLRAVIETSGGLAGVLRLEHISQLRQLSLKSTEGNIESSLLRPMISGNSRLQLDTISQLDTAVLRLGVLAGKVGLAASEDALNSLAANELIQNREQIDQALQRLADMVSDELKVRLRKLKDAAHDLATRVGDESVPNSLASLHRRKLREYRNVQLSQITMANVSERLESSTENLRNYLQDVARRAKDSAALTIQRSRYVVLSISVVTLVLGCIAASRVRISVLALRVQNQRLSELSDELTNTNQGLEQCVADRTASLQLVLDSTGDGLLSIDLTGVLQPERSKAVSAWFGPSSPGDTLWDYIAIDVATKESLAIAIEQMADDVLPFEVAADQAPKSFERNGKTYALVYHAVREHEQMARILISLRDITSELIAQQAEAQMRELHTLVGNLLRDHSGFEQTIDECSTLLSDVSRADNVVIAKRHLHTLKGNCSSVGFFNMAKLVHTQEEKLVDSGCEPTTEDILELNRCWQSSLSNISAYLKTKREDLIEIAASELEELKERIQRGDSRKELERFADNWKNEPTYLPLSRLADQARQVATRLGKKVEVRIEGNQLRIPEHRLRRFWLSMTHAIRNAIDHGIESPEERLRLGKSEIARLRLETRQDSGFYEFEVSDDGCGIDWERVRQVASKRGLPHATHADLIEALFCDGFSTRIVSTEVSGRGIGLSAVRNECEKAGGQVRLASSPGAGTSFVFRFPESFEPSAAPKAVILDSLNPEVQSSIASRSPA